MMAKIAQQKDWLEEETANMAREGLRTLIVARRQLSDQSYAHSKEQNHQAAARAEAADHAGEAPQ